MRESRERERERYREKGGKREGEVLYCFGLPNVSAHREAEFDKGHTVRER